MTKESRRNLKEARNKSHMSQQQVADYLDISLRHYQNIVARKENLELMTFKEHVRLNMKERHALKKGGMTYQ